MKAFECKLCGRGFATNAGAAHHVENYHAKEMKMPQQSDQVVAAINCQCHNTVLQQIIDAAEAEARIDDPNASEATIAAVKRLATRKLFTCPGIQFISFPTAIFAVGDEAEAHRRIHFSQWIAQMAEAYNARAAQALAAVVERAPDVPRPTLEKMQPGVGVIDTSEVEQATGFAPSRGNQFPPLELLPTGPPPTKASEVCDGYGGKAAGDYPCYRCGWLFSEHQSHKPAEEEEVIQ